MTKETQSMRPSMLTTVGGCALPPPTQGRGGDDFPEFTVYSHTGEAFALHRDLIKGRVVLVNFFTILQHPLYPATEHLLRVADQLGDRLGSEVFIYSITLDPDNDTPLRMRRFALDHGVPEGWLFLSAVGEWVEALTRRLFKTKALCGYAYGHPANVVHIGNGTIGLWSRFVADIDPGLARDKIVRLIPKESDSEPGAPRRAGPTRYQEAATPPSRSDREVTIDG
ncbi:MAG: SCO family protein [Pseudomonadota bacterium]